MYIKEERVLRKWTVWLPVCLLICLVCTACQNKDRASSAPAADSSAAGTEPALSSEPATDPTRQIGEGDIGPYHIQIRAAQKAKDRSKQDVLIVTYEWTNHSESETAFLLAFDVKAYQNGTACSEAAPIDGLDTQKLTVNVAPENSLVLQNAYLLRDDSTVTIEVTPRMNLDPEEIVIKTYAVA